MTLEHSEKVRVWKRNDDWPRINADHADKRKTLGQFPVSDPRLSASIRGCFEVHRRLGDVNRQPVFRGARATAVVATHRSHRELT